MPLMAPTVPDPPPPPMPAPWSWTVAELGKHLTESQRKTILARLRVEGFPVKAWTYPTK